MKQDAIRLAIVALETCSMKTGYEENEAWFDKGVVAAALTALRSMGDVVVVPRVPTKAIHDVLDWETDTPDDEERLRIWACLLEAAAGEVHE